MKTPRVLLIGAGRFGQHHARILEALDKRGVIRFAGIVVRSAIHARTLRRTFGVPVYSSLSNTLLKNVDAVDVVTPYSSHAALIRRCLRHAHVFVEKPLAASAREARSLATLAQKCPHTLFVGHIYRYHPVTARLIKSINPRQTWHIEGTHLNPRNTYRGEDPALENLHVFDIMDVLFQRAPEAVWCIGDERHVTASLRYRNADATFSMGWKGRSKVRSITLTSRNERVEADFVSRRVVVRRRGATKTYVCTSAREPLEEELRAWLRIVTGSREHYPDVEVGARIVSVAARCKPQKAKKVAVIGAGVFGMTAALELARTHEVHVFDRATEILAGTTSHNQFRHHMGYHYPRSTETIDEIQSSTASFERMYGDALIQDFASYYCIDAHNSRVSARAFESVCRAHRLPLFRAMPQQELLARESVAASYVTHEGIYDPEALRRIIERRMKRLPKLRVSLGHDVIKISLADTGKKILVTRHGAKIMRYSYDYVINASYANHNAICSQLGFGSRPMELRHKEIVRIRLPSRERVAITIMDGPFATIVPTATPGIYTFGDVPLSILDTRGGGRGADQYRGVWSKTAKTRWPQMRSRCKHWFPILDHAQYVDSIFTVLPVDTESLGDDARRSTVTNHGFGCYSVLSGKVITAVQAAEQLGANIRRV